MTLNWQRVKDSKYDELVCDPNHPKSFIKKLPMPSKIACKQCGIGESRDKDGNCNFC